MARTSKPTVMVVIRDEASAAVERLRKEFAQLGQEARTTGIAKEMGLLEGTAFAASREFGTTLSLLGLSGAFVTGGVVASISAMTVALGRFARESQSMRFAAEEIGLTQKQYQQFAFAARFVGVTNDPAVGLYNLGQSLKDLSRWGQQDAGVFRRFKQYSPDVQVMAREFGAVYKDKGMVEAFMHVFRTMREAPGSEPNKQWFREIFAKELGLGDIGYMNIDEPALRQFAEVAVAQADKVDKFVATLTRLNTEMEVLKDRAATALLPPFTELFKVLRSALQGEQGTEFKKWLIETISQLDKIDWTKIREGVTATVPRITKAINEFAPDARIAIEDISQIQRIVDKWRGVRPGLPMSGTPWGGATAGVPGLPGTPSGPDPTRISGAEGDEVLLGGTEFSAQSRTDADKSLWSRIMAGLRFADVFRQGGLMRLGEQYAGMTWPSWMESVAWVTRSPMLGYAGYATPGMITPGVPMHRGIETFLEGFGGGLTWGGRFFDQWRRMRANRWGIGGATGNWVVDERQRSRVILKATTKDVSDELFKLNDKFRLNRAGAGGGNVEGGVTEAGRNRPMETKAGGAGGSPRFDPHTGERIMPPGAKFDPWTGEPLTTGFNPWTGKRLPLMRETPFTGTPWGGEATGVSAQGKMGTPSGVTFPKPVDALTKLGAQAVGQNIYRFDEKQAASRYSGLSETTLGIMQERVAGFTMGIGKPFIMYEPNRATSPLTVMHEIGHAGRQVVSEYPEQNIFKRYLYGTPAEKTKYGTKEAEERMQRALDIDTTTKMYARGDVEALPSFLQRSEAEGYLATRAGKLGPGGKFGESASRGELEELRRHNLIMEERAQQILNLSINVEGERGRVNDFDTSSDGIDVTVNRDMRSQLGMQ